MGHCPHFAAGAKALRSQHVSREHRVLCGVYSKTEVDSQGHQLQVQCSVLFVTLPQGFLDRVVVGLLPPKCLKSARSVGTGRSRRALRWVDSRLEYSLWDRSWG